jgi:hypothetical protein
MESIDFVIVGGGYYQIAAELGKKGASADVSIYDRKTQDVFTLGLCLSLIQTKYNL